MKDYIELKNNNITITDTESGAIAYVCKMNNTQCIIIIIKGISDFPEDEIEKDKFESNEVQLNVYLNNTPIVMKKIFDKYLLKFI